MFTALMMTAVLSCKPAMPPPQQTSLRCEGADQVRRTWDGEEIGRWHNATACTRVRCEGADFVRRDVFGTQVERWSFAPQCMTVSCEGSDYVRRDSRGFELERWTNAALCPRPTPPVRLTSDPKPVRFGLSRG